MIYIFIILFILVIFVFVTYNRLVKLNNLVKEGFSTMDIYLKKRWDLIPNLVEVVKAYEEYEKETIEEITKLRAQSYENMNIDSKLNANEILTQGLKTIMVVAENYPQLKASENFSQLSKELTKIEDDIANSRKYYNGTVRKLNDKIQSFPSNVIAGMFGFKEAKMFEIDADEKNNIKVDV